MNHKRPPLPAIIVILLVVVLSAYFLITQTLGKNNGALTASGFIEATQVNVASELAGKVVDVLAAVFRKERFLSLLLAWTTPIVELILFAATIFIVSLNIPL